MADGFRENDERQLILPQNPAGPAHPILPDQNPAGPAHPIVPHLNRDQNHAGRNDNQRYNKLRKCLIAQGIVIGCLAVVVVGLLAGVVVVYHSLSVANSSSGNQIDPPPTLTCYQETANCTYSIQRSSQSEETDACSTEPLLTHTKVRLVNKCNLLINRLLGFSSLYSSNNRYRISWI